MKHGAQRGKLPEKLRDGVLGERLAVLAASAVALRACAVERLDALDLVAQGRADGRQAETERGAGEGGVRLRIAAVAAGKQQRDESFERFRDCELAREVRAADMVCGGAFAARVELAKDFVQNVAQPGFGNGLVFVQGSLSVSRSQAREAR